MRLHCTTEVFPEREKEERKTVLKDGRLKRGEEEVRLCRRGGGGRQEKERKGGVRDNDWSERGGGKEVQSRSKKELMS